MTFDAGALFKQIFMGVCGLSFGLLASAGVFTVLVSVGLIPRFAGKMHVAKKVFVLEEAVIFGTLCGGALSVFYKSPHPGDMEVDWIWDFDVRRRFCRYVCGLSCPCHC